MDNLQSFPSDYARVGVGDSAAKITTFLRAVYGWMAIGLAVTAVVAYLVADSSLPYMLASNRMLFWALFLGQLGIVFVISARVHTLSPAVAGGLFLVYSAVTGVTLSFLLLLYTGASVASTFVVTAGMFGALALFGTVTTRSLAGWSQFLFMGLIGIVLASVVGIFWQNSLLQFLIAFCGVIVFTGLTAYDAQMLKAMAMSLPNGQVGAYAIRGALTLYLDFINLFISLLRLFGDRRR